MLNDRLNARFLEAGLTSRPTNIIDQVANCDNDIPRAHAIGAMSRRDDPFGCDDCATTKHNVWVAIVSKGCLMRNGAYLTTGVDFVFEEKC